MKIEALLVLLFVPVGLLAVFADRVATFQYTPSARAPIVAQLPVAVPAPVATAAAVVPSSIEAMLAYARSWLGVPYKWGGAGRSGIDCSAFVQNVLTAAGVGGVPRTTTSQVRWTVPVARERLMPGDLVYFDNTCTGCGANPTHVGMAIGGGLMIQSGGAGVSIQPIFSGFYGPLFSGAGRVPQWT